MTMSADSNLIWPIMTKIIKISRRMVRESEMENIFHEGWIQIIQSFKISSERDLNMETDKKLLKIKN